jgi:hypothetical protein
VLSAEIYVGPPVCLSVCLSFFLFLSIFLLYLFVCLSVDGWVGRIAQSMCMRAWRWEVTPDS